MNFKDKIVYLIIILCLQFTSFAKAQFLPNECAIVASTDNSIFIITSEIREVNNESTELYSNLNPKLCKDLKTLGESMQIISGLLTPLAVFAANPIISNALSAQAAALGISLANPVVLSVVVFGGMGLNTIYFIYKKSIQECAELNQQLLKNQIIDELKLKFNLEPAGNIDFSIDL